MGSDEKNEYQRLTDTRARDGGATSPVVAAAMPACATVNHAMQELTGG